MSASETDHNPAWPDYLPDRYDRLRGCAEELASGANFAEDAFIDADMVRAFAQTLCDAKMLDGLTDHDADTVTMLSVLDFTRGLVRMAWRLTDWLSDHRTVGRQDDDELAVVSVLARVLSLAAAAFVGEEFAVVQQHHSLDPSSQGSEH